MTQLRDAETEACPHGPGAQGAYEQTPRTTATRYQSRVDYDRAAVHAVLDEALVCHLAFVVDGGPVVLPTVHARIGDRLYVHGSSGGRFSSLDGRPVGVTVTLHDALVLARSWFHHSVAFRSVVVHGTARVVADPAERLDAMRALIDHIAPGRTAESREPTRKELASTAILAVDLEQVSLKSRGDNVVDDEEDLALPYWAGSIPLAVTAGVGKPSPDLRDGIDAPGYARHYVRPRACDHEH
ncbi:pyridoxamine 5'-phosphate oxidase family protein [Catenulispora sp. NF23]|uniref:Pyridoxamine 5'-phosphate oxidase family protein n=1 Tax=Catenulispora pinistramenti TaxID=2705254 RepID=A0ABS5L4K7_9ACTN|nr:pyridoxamine 5'-phosphate oxidase family protein [Catenulispora pinistramenti]MBS2539113.1 pyridoxamine 5'-phosphate oxidase family protein [Catenulispora pinistramenti]MBS2553165.1 pyridoxamine 5'-phosphate oxidase family protein [Catenulispora pinistramenti]